MFSTELKNGWARGSTRSARVVAVAAWALLGVARLPAAEPMFDINVNVTLTEAGRKLSRPTRERPVYYYPFMAQSSAEGVPVAGEKFPAKMTVARLLAKALAQQGYLVSTSEKSPPTLILVCHWGGLTVDEDKGNPGSETEPVRGSGGDWQTEFNKNLRVAMVSGRNGHEVDPIGRPSVLSQQDADAIGDAADDRYFIIVSAYDVETYRTQKKKLLLWQARMSVPSARTDSFAQVMTALVETGAPFFGRETLPPQRLKVPVLPTGKVEIGTPTVVPNAAPAEPKKMP